MELTSASLQEASEVPVDPWVPAKSVASANGFVTRAAGANVIIHVYSPFLSILHSSSTFGQGLEA
ncbi:MAG: hypothetical protein ACREBU_00190 [Nitrososphaera sp.]